MTENGNKDRKEEVQLRSKLWKTDMLIRRLESRVEFLRAGKKPVNVEKAVLKIKGSKCTTQV